MNKKGDNNAGKPTSIRQSNTPKEPFTYTPSWMSPKERSKLKARVMKLKKREEKWGMKKEEDVLVQKSRDKSPGSSHKSPSSEVDVQKSEDAMSKKGSSSTENDDAASMGRHSSVVSSEASLSAPLKTSTPKSSKKPKKSRGSSDSLSKKKSREDLPKKKSKEELAMAKKQKSKHPKAVHANPSGNLVEEQQPWIPHPRDTIEAHLWATDYKNFDPQLYAFKTPEKLSTKKPVMAECPPFWVLCDHTIAVAWKLYCKDADRSDLGIVALQWSREFVSAMKDERGEYPNAIKHFLDAIEDGLIFRYSRAAEDSKKAHEKDDDISYASSDSVFKHPIEVSYTLKDILSRNFPGRKFGDDRENKSILRKDDKNAAAVSKSTILPLSVLGDGEIMQQKDLISLLKQCKIEQEARIKHEMNASMEIDRLLKQAQEGKLPIQVEKKEHVGFDVPDGSEPSVTASKSSKRQRKDADLKKSASATSNRSTKSGASGKSATSSKSGKSSESREAHESSLGSELSGVSDGGVEPDSLKSSKAMKKKKSTDDLGKKQSRTSVSSEGDVKGTKNKSKDSVDKKKSKESISSSKSKESTSSKKKGSKESTASKKKGSAESKSSKKGSKESKSSKKGSKESKGSKKESK